MAKKSSLSINLFVIGMIIVAVGCFLPLTSSKIFGGSSSAFNAITKGDGALKIGAALTLLGAAAGIIFSFVSLKGVPVKLISLIVSIAGGIYVLIKYLNIGGLGQSVIKFTAKATQSGPGLGLFVIIIGWILAIVGFIKNRG